MEIAFIKKFPYFLFTQIIWFRPTKLYQFMDHVNGVVHYPMVIDNDFDFFVALCCERWIGFQFKCLKSEAKKVASTAKNTVISPDFLVWKFCRKGKFLQSFGQTTLNFAFPQNFYTRKSGKITVFFAVKVRKKITNVGKVTFCDTCNVKAANLFPLTLYWR